MDPLAGDIIRAVLDAADPAEAVARHWPEELPAASRVVLVAAGKGSAAMARTATERIGSRLCRGAVACVPEHRERLVASLRQAGCEGVVTVCPADHPLPTERNLVAARAIGDAAALATERDVVLALISGGASAHLTMPAEGLTLDDMRAVTRGLQRAGATIGELNAVRKHCERLKGGGLARLAWPAAMRVLVLSDVLGDPLDVVGSGPTSADPSTFGEALAVLDRYSLRRVSPAVTARLVRGARGDEDETPKPGDEILAGVRHTVVANNRAAVDAAAEACRRAGVRDIRVRHGVEGEAAEVGRSFGAALRGAAGEGRPVALVWGGETTVTVGDADGRGGRNTECALAAAEAIEGLDRSLVIALATDGVDGPTDSAGAVVDGEMVGKLRAAGVNIADAFVRHDSYTVLDRVSALIRTGPTGTNVNDVLVGIAR